MRQFLILILFIISANAQAQRTIGLTQHDADLPGYVLFSPIPNNTTYLIDGCGREVHHWTCTGTPGLSAQLQPDGTLLRTRATDDPDFHGGGVGGIIDRYNWEGDLIWSYSISSDSLCQHHDFTVLPNGNILTIAWEAHTAQDAFTHGLGTPYQAAMFWSERLIELHPSGTDQADVIWQWRAWDHLVQDHNPALANYDQIAQRPRRIDINYRDGGPVVMDWLHINSIVYNPDRDEVMVSAHNFDEVWVIDHGTTTTEAAGSTGGAKGHGGDLLYRWGNPVAYKNGTSADRKFHHQHNATWLPPGHPDAGKIMVFNNQNASAEGNYSSVVIFDPPLDAEGRYIWDQGSAAGPDTASWTWTAPVPTDFFSQGIGGATPVGDGFLFTEGQSGRLVGIDGSGTEIWQYIDPVSNTGPLAQGSTILFNTVFRCEHYADDFPGFVGHDLSPGDVIELNPLPSLCLTSGVGSTTNGTFTVHPNPACDRVTLSGTGAISAVELVDINGRILSLPYMSKGAQFICDLADTAPGLYTLRLVNADPSRSMTTRLMILH